MDNEKRTALVTGASAGLGVEFGKQLAFRGYDVVLVARREERLKAVAANIKERHGVHAYPFAADLASPDAPPAIFQKVQDLGVNIDYLVNNAGSAGPDLLQQRDWTKQEEFLELMMISVARMCHLFAPGMQARRFGRIINVASVAGRIPRKGDLNYGPSKAYLIALSEALDLTLRPYGVRVCALCPGFTHTEFHAVAGMLERKAQLPGFIWYDADVVVREALSAIEKGKSVFVSGRLYRWLDPFLQSVWTRHLIKFLNR